MRCNSTATVTELRRYAVLDVKQAKEVASAWLESKQLANAVSFGLPEVDDRYHVWRVPILSNHTSTTVGEIVIDARPEYTDYLTYEEYLLKLRKIIQNCHHVLAEGRFFVINVSPVLLRRTNRNEASKRIAVPFDVHQLFVGEGFDFIDDIIWVKPEGAGWATGRGRRFAADRNPLQYKSVPVTEYILVYRKHTDKLIDWKIKPAHDKRHPAVFPLELAQKVIMYYSFRNDVILDPFAGIGTTAIAATKLKRRFVMIEENPQYVKYMKDDVKKSLGKAAKTVLTKNTDGWRGYCANEHELLAQGGCT